MRARPYLNPIKTRGAEGTEENYKAGRGWFMRSGDRSAEGAENTDTDTAASPPGDAATDTVPLHTIFRVDKTASY